jgi:hypothetical protein
VMTQIVALAQAHSLAGKMSSNQAYYVQGWVVGAVAIAYIKVRETGIATAAETKTIADWMQSVREQTKSYYGAHKRAGHGDSQNNHLTGLESSLPRLAWRRTIARTSIGRWRLTTTESIRYTRTELREDKPLFVRLPAGGGFLDQF